MRIAKILQTSFVDGPGINFTIFFQGCNKHPHCPECHNPTTHDCAGGTELSFAEVTKLISKVRGVVSGVTFTGGEPLDQKSAILALALWCSSRNLRTTLFTGYTMTVLNKFTTSFDYRSQCVLFPTSVIKLFDYIVDGDFQKAKKDLTLAFRGSSNQRLLQKGLDY